MLSVIRNVWNFLSQLASWSETLFTVECNLIWLVSGPSLSCFCLFQGGIAPGGFNFDAKLWVLHYLSVLFHVCFFNHNFITENWEYFRRRESTDVEDLFIAHIVGMDTMARGLRNAAKLIEVIPSASSLASIYILIIQISYFLTFLDNQTNNLSLYLDWRMVLWLSLSASDIRVLTQKLGLK